MTLKQPSLSYEDLLPYQLRMIEHIRENACCALWVDMGLGKTVSTLTALQHLIEDYETNHVLVVAPLRVARKTWTDEIETWAHLRGLTTSKIIGTAQQRLAGARRRADIHLVNRENMEWLASHFMENRNGKWYKTAAWPWDTVVLDESTSFKNQDNNRYRALRRCRKWMNRVIQLTGTPSPKGLQDLWAQAYLLDGGVRLGNTLGAFRRRWMDPPDWTQTKWKMKPAAEPQIHSAMSDIALTLRAEDYLDLPPMIGLENPQSLVRVEMSASERAQYERFARTMVMELAGERITAANAGVLWGKLLQLSNGAVYVDHPKWEAFHDRKLEALLDIEDTNSEPMMIIYNYKPDLYRICEAFDRRGVNYRVLKTEQDEEDWNAGLFDRLILHPASAGHGTNLHKNGCELQLWYGLTASTEQYQQTVARIAGGHRRLGKSVRILHLVADDSQDDMARWILEDDTAQQDRLMEATKQVIRAYS